MLLADIPRRIYTPTQTPIEKLSNLSKELGGPTIYMKRDDLLGLTAGGNKTRKLEFLIADALNTGANTIITCGAIQSNHCRLTLAAAVKEGLQCQLVLEEKIPGTYSPDASGNNFLYRLLGAENIKVVPNGSDVLEEMNTLATNLKEKGRKPYVIPVGGSNEIGALGYIACAQEIIDQTFALGVKMDYLVSVIGSGSTFAGIALGFGVHYSDVEMLGMGITGNNDTLIPLVHHHIDQTAAFLQIPFDIPKDRLTFYDDYVGEGYAIPTLEMKEAVKLVARTESILLDPVYTGKAMAGLIDLIQKGTFTKNDNILFIHTGGSPALYANTDLFLEG